MYNFIHAHAYLESLHELFVVLGLFGEVVVLDAVADRLPLNVRRDQPKVLRVQKELLFELLLLVLRPHVQELPLVVFSGEAGRTKKGKLVRNKSFSSN